MRNVVKFIFENLWENEMRKPRYKNFFKALPS